MSSNEIKTGSENVFLDLGFSSQEAENLRIRSELMDQITTLIETQNWSIGAASTYLGTSIESVEALHKGKIGQFSIEQLMTMLTYTGMRIHVEVLPAAA